jgi:parvulin-like peptidyl-prolyl isomerase
MTINADFRGGVGRWWRIAWSLFLGLLLISLLARRVEAAESAAIARVGGETVRTEEVRRLLAVLDPREQAALARDPALLSQTVRTLLVQRMILAEAQSKHWDQQPEVAAKLERVRQSTLLESYLASVSEPPAEYPTEDDLRVAYEANRSSYQVPRQFRIAQIFVAQPKSAEPSVAEKAQAKLDAVAKKLQVPGADFAAIARSESEEIESASRGGEIGWLTEAQIQTELRARVIGLAPGGVSEPRQLADGWHILKLLEVRDPRVASLAEVRQPLAQQLRIERSRVNAQAYVAKLARETPVSLNELALAEVLNKPAK